MTVVHGFFVFFQPSEVNELCSWSSWFHIFLYSDVQFPVNPLQVCFPCPCSRRTNIPQPPHSCCCISASTLLNPLLQKSHWDEIKLPFSETRFRIWPIKAVGTQIPEVHSLTMAGVVCVHFLPLILTQAHYISQHQIWRVDQQLCSELKHESSSRQISSFMPLKESNIFPSSIARRFSILPFLWCVQGDIVSSHSSCCLTKSSATLQETLPPSCRQWWLHISWSGFTWISSTISFTRIVNLPNVMQHPQHQSG